MVIAIRNRTGLELYLAISAGERSMRFRVTSVPPVLEEGEEGTKLRPGEGFGIVDCPDGFGAKVDVTRAGLAIRVARRRERLDKIGDDGQLDGEETYLEFVLTLLN